MHSERICVQVYGLKPLSVLLFVLRCVCVCGWCRWNFERVTKGKPPILGLPLF